VMLLDDEACRLVCGGRPIPGRLARGGEIALGAV
jgi:hypothetical protein